MSFRPLCRTIQALLCLSLLVSTARAQSATEILERARAAYEARMTGIDDYTIVTEQFTTYYKKVEQDGRMVWRSYMRLNTGDLPGSLDGYDLTTDIPTFLEDIAPYTAYVDEETLDGQRVHHLRVESFPPDAFGEDADDAPERMDLYLDTERLVPLRMEIADTKEIDGQTRSIEQVIRFEDYREVDGLLYPFRTVMELSGLNAELSEEDRAKAREGMAELKKQLAEMPEAQANMMRKMLEPQLKRLESMLASGTMTMEIVVTDLKVNTGVPDEYFRDDP